jgi:superfamily II DNA or RNA helicase
MIELRPYQAAAIDDARAAYRAGHRAVLFQLPTGGGKTITASVVVQGAAAKQNCVWWLVHRRELAAQASRTFHELGIPHGTVQSGFVSNPLASVQVTSIQTIVRRLEKLPAPDLIVFDEAHHLGAASWEAIFDRFPKARVLGLTATPWRLDGQGLGRWFGHMVRGPSTADLIEQGSLSPYRLFAPATPDLSAVTTTAGDYQQSALAKAMDKPQIVGDAIGHYQRLCPGKRAVVFAAGVENSAKVAAQFNAVGIAAEHVDGSMTSEARDSAVARFRRGETLILCNSDLFGEGFDVPAIEAAILLRPTKSLSLHLQQVGRALRPAPGKDCLASGTRILTQRGQVEIEQINSTDLLWDGNSWVRHGGVISKGFQNVITYEGLTATRDHEVWTAQGWRTFGHCADQQIAIVETGIGGRTIRLNRNRLPRIAVGWERVEPEDSRLHPLHWLRSRAVDFAGELAAWAHEGLSRLQSTSAFSEMALCANAGSTATLHQPESHRMAGLRRAWHYLRLPWTGRSSSLGAGTPWAAGQSENSGDRQDRQRQRLRAEQPPLVNPRREPVSHSRFSQHCDDAQVQDGASRGKVCGRHTETNDRPWNDVPANRRSVPEAVSETKRQVWDILDTGPRNCFTAEGLLVHNCATILDHAGNSLLHGLPDDVREWRLEDRERRKKSEVSDTPVRQCKQCFFVYRPAPKCPQCGSAAPVAMREIEQVDGELAEVKSIPAWERKREQRECETLDDLIHLAIRRGYKNPSFWARRIIDGRGSRQSRWAA